MSPMLAFAIETAYQAGRRTLAHFRTGVMVERKGDQTPVTIADRDAETHIREAIRKQYPAHGILGEEHGTEGSEGERWVVDPIDGTKSFISGVPLYATLLAFEKEGVPQIGVCYFPGLDEMVYAERGGGTFWNGRAAHVSQTATMQDAVICAAGPGSVRKYGHEAGLMKLADQALATRSWCDAYGHALVATGRVEAMIDPVVNRWDISAMQVIVEEAGGLFVNFQGQPGLFGEAISVNQALHREVLGAFAS